MVIDRRDKILAFIKQYRDANGFAPTYREIAAGCGVASVSNIKHHLVRLEADGLITQRRNVPRGIVVVQ